MKNERRGKLTVGQKKEITKAKPQNSRYNNVQNKVLIINADTEKGLVYGFQQ